MYIGLIALASEMTTVLQVRNTSNVPIEPDAAPTYRIYGEDGSPIASGTLSQKDTGAITGATNANPIVITSASHGLVNGLRVTITGVGGNTAANTTAVVANKTTDTFELTGVAGSGAYTSGGNWAVTGSYGLAYTPESGNGFDQGRTYTVIFSYLVSTVAYSPPDATRSFTVT